MLCSTGIHARNIPAHAGKTFEKVGLMSNVAEHPRARGENKLCCSSPRAGSGTSPRTRGKLPLRANSIHHQRNIPAHAGKTIRLQRCRSNHKEHPRARGENFLFLAMNNSILGTSPRTRGKPGRTAQKGLGRRNIPAHAGKTLDCGAEHNSGREHPRARGENFDGSKVDWEVEGTSPRTRGKLTGVAMVPFPAWNIPAHAGKTPRAPPGRSHCWEHPRARGENVRSYIFGVLGVGTSPRTRGKRSE